MAEDGEMIVKLDELEIELCEYIGKLRSSIARRIMFLMPK